MLFYRKDEQPYVEQVDDFFKDMATPIQPEEQELGDHDNESRQCTVLGNLCLVYGAFILLLVLIPNEASRATDHLLLQHVSLLELAWP